MAIMGVGRFLSIAQHRMVVRAELEHFSRGGTQMRIWIWLAVEHNPPYTTLGEFYYSHTHGQSDFQLPAGLNMTMLEYNAHGWPIGGIGYVLGGRWSDFPHWWATEHEVGWWEKRGDQNTLMSPNSWRLWQHLCRCQERVAQVLRRYGGNPVFQADSDRASWTLYLGVHRRLDGLIQALEGKWVEMGLH